MKTSARGIALIQQYESCKLTAYQDGGGVWTIGWGHTGNVSKGDKITQKKADSLFACDLAATEIAVERSVKAPINQEMFDALVSLTYNIGIAHFTDVAHCTTLRELNATNYVAAAEGILLWNKDNGKVVPGLVKRRSAERQLFLEGVNKLRANKGKA